MMKVSIRTMSTIRVLATRDDTMSIVTIEGPSKPTGTFFCSLYGRGVGAMLVYMISDDVHKYTQFKNPPHQHKTSVGEEFGLFVFL
jgi:hypothetical protein